MTAEEIFTNLQASFPGLEKSGAPVKAYPTWTVPAGSLRAVCDRLRTKYSFDYLDMITAVDWPASASPAAAPAAVPAAAPVAAPTAAGRDIFELVYVVSALSTGLRLCLRCEIPRAAPSAHSLYGIFMAADWQEREVYDLYGIKFEGHPNLKRVLTPETQQGHPLRKDYVHVPDCYD